MVKNLFLFVLVILVASCAPRRITYKPYSQYVFEENDTLFKFNKEAIKGLWLTDGYNSKAFRSFDSTFFLTSFKHKASQIPYRVTKDSIYIDNRNKVYSGRLIFQTKNQLKIQWGNREVISYYRKPRSVWNMIY